MKKRRIMIDTPCPAKDIDGILQIVSHEGHWHDAVVKGEDGKIVVEFETDEE